MVLEVQMQDFGNDENSYPCIIQYVLFPPHVVPNAALERDSGTEDDTEEGRNISLSNKRIIFYDKQMILHVRYR